MKICILSNIWQKSLGNRAFIHRYSQPDNHVAGTEAKYVTCETKKQYEFGDKV